MALERANRVKQSTTTTGTGSVSLNGYFDGFRAFSGVITDGATVRYLIESADQLEWEVGEGTFDNDTETLSRDSIFVSSAGVSAVDFSAGTKAVSLVLTAEDIVDASNSIITNETPSGDLDGADTTYTLVNEPIAGTLALYLNGQRLTYTEDYTLATNVITFVTAPISGDIIRADYLLAGAGSGNADTLDNANSSTDGTFATNSDGLIPTEKAVKTYADSLKVAAQNLLKNGNFINNSTNGYGSTPDDWTSSNANPVQGGIPALTKQNLIDGLGIADGDIEGLWPLNEASGNALDLSSNAYNLVDINTVGVSSDGLMAAARDFELANSEGFTLADASCPNLEIAGSQTWFAFIKPESFATIGQVMCKRIANASIAGKFFQVQTNGTIGFEFPGLATTASMNSDVVLQAGKWYLCAIIYDSVNSLVKIWVNGIKKQATATGTMTDTNGIFAIGQRPHTVADQFFDGLIQNAAILSVALTDNQVKKLFAMTMYKGQKIRRATTDAYVYQQLPQDLVERLRGKTVSLRADLYQEVASTAWLSIHQTMADGTTDELIFSNTDATTGSWLSKVATGTLEADVVTIEIRLRHSDSDGNTWFKNVSLYEGAHLFPYDHSKEDWSRFPRLLKMDIPAILAGKPYEFEENRAYAITPIFDFDGTDPTVNSIDKSFWSYSGKVADINIFADFTNAGATNTNCTVQMPIVHAETFATGSGYTRSSGGVNAAMLRVYTTASINCDFGSQAIKQVGVQAKFRIA